LNDGFQPLENNSATQKSNKKSTLIWNIN
jgi:hypothetical protein